MYKIVQNLLTYISFLMVNKSLKERFSDSFQSTIKNIGLGILKWMVCIWKGIIS